MILPESLVHPREMDHCVRVHTVLVQGPPEEEVENASTYAFSFPAEGIYISGGILALASTRDFL